MSTYRYANAKDSHGNTENVSGYFDKYSNTDAFVMSVMFASDSNSWSNLFSSYLIFPEVNTLSFVAVNCAFCSEVILFISMISPSFFLL